MNFLRFVPLTALLLSAFSSCTPPVRRCGSAPCAVGCCDANGACQPGGAIAACGTDGSDCRTCGTGQACMSGQCSTQNSMGSDSAQGDGMAGSGVGSVGDAGMGGGAGGGGEVVACASGLGSCGTARCALDADCGPGARCCDGSCAPGDCCETSDCLGRVCRQHRCQACDSAAQCGAGQVCCSGLCRTGECCATGDCAAGQVCRAGRCTFCRNDAECGEGERCASGACVASTPGAPVLECADGTCVSALPQVAALTGQACASQGDCAFAEVCCNGSCINGECCNDVDCAGVGFQCIAFACQSCVSDAQCGAGRVCCSGSCNQGDCCPGDRCAGGGVCSSNRCSACTNSRQCGDGSVCCNGACKAGDCCASGDCGQYVCGAGQCGACRADGDCGGGRRCCAGACTTDQCCSSADCSGGQLCLKGQCARCANDAQCGPGSVCCNGSCKVGNCCSTANCPGGQTCRPSGVCGLCQSDAECSAGQRCCGGACVNGNCCLDRECGQGRVCRAFSCEACAEDRECPRGSVCCNGGCQRGNCCTPDGRVAATPDCNGLVCSGSECSSCTADAQCGRGSKCCGGACYAGIECCSAADCQGGLACVAGRCRGCSSNAECGALSCCDPDGPGGQPGRCRLFCSLSRCFTDRSTFNEGIAADTTASGTNLNPQCTAGRLCATTSAPGTWTVVIDSQVVDAAWQQVDLTTLKPAGTAVLVRAKTAASAAALANVDWWNGLLDPERKLPELAGSVSFQSNSGLICLPTGRFLKLELTLVPANGTSPVVSSVCVRWGPSGQCRPRAFCDPNATLSASGTSCTCNEGFIGNGLSCVPACIRVEPASVDISAYQVEGDPSAWIFGTIGDNYWCSRCSTFTRSYNVRVPSLRALREARIYHLGFDDWVTVRVNGTVALCGPHGCWNGTQACELSTSWSYPVNVDLKPLLREGDNQILVDTVVAGCGEFWLALRLDSGFNTCR